MFGPINWWRFHSTQFYRHGRTDGTFTEYGIILISRPMASLCQLDNSLSCVPTPPPGARAGLRSALPDAKDLMALTCGGESTSAVVA